MTEPAAQWTRIQNDLMEGKPLADLLRNCLLLGSSSGSQDVREWAARELKGYEDFDTLPKYRKIPAAIQLDGLTGNTHVTGQNVAASQLPEEVRESVAEGVPIFQGVGELQALYESTSQSTKSTHITLPRWEYIGYLIDNASGNPFQQTLAIYWSISPSALAGVLDHTRTALTEMLAELGALVPLESEQPTGEQVDRAFNLAITGDSAQVTIAAPTSSVTAHSGSAVHDVVTGPTAASGGDLHQEFTLTVPNQEAIKGWLDDYKTAILSVDPEIRGAAETQIDHIERELTKEAPNAGVVRGLLLALKAFTASVITGAGASAGVTALAEVLAHVPI